MNGRQKIALVSIGQTPRPDITDDYGRMWRDQFEIAEYGALDGCDGRTIRELAPRPGEADLVTRLAGGDSVLVSHERLTPYVQRAVDRAAAAGAAAVVVQCTGRFALRSGRTLIYPYDVLEHSARLLPGGGKSLFLLTPTAGQVKEAETRWRARGYAIAATRVVAPFDGLEAALDSLRRDPALAGADALVGDCYGFTNAFYQRARAFYRGPILIPRRLIAKLLDGVWEGGANE